LRRHPHESAAEVVQGLCEPFQGSRLQPHTAVQEQALVCQGLVKRNCRCSARPRRGRCRTFVTGLPCASRTRTMAAAAGCSQPGAPSDWSLMTTLNVRSCWPARPARVAASSAGGRTLAAGRPLPMAGRRPPRSPSVHMSVCSSPPPEISGVSARRAVRRTGLRLNAHTQIAAHNMGSLPGEVWWGPDYMSAWGSLGGIGSRASQRPGRPPVFRRRHLVLSICPTRVFSESLRWDGTPGSGNGGRLRSARVSSAERDRALQVRDLEAAGSLRSKVCAAPRRRRDTRHRNRPDLSGHPTRVFSYGGTR
jgi:hypothetical protein